MNRFYSPQQGRFTQGDPIGMGAASLSDPQTLNLYAYCGNDPINHVDPDGFFFGKLFGWIGKIGKIFKWIGIAITIAVGVLSIVGAVGVAFKISMFFAKHKFLANLLGIGGKLGTFGTPPINGSGIGGVSSFVGQQDPPREIPQDVLDEYITHEAWSILEDGAVLYEATMDVTYCESWKCWWNAVKKGLKVGAKRGIKNVLDNPGAIITTAITRGRFNPVPYESYS